MPQQYEERLTSVEDGMEKLSTQVLHLEKGQQEASLARSELKTELNTKLDMLTKLSTETLQAVGKINHVDKKQDEKLKKFDELLSDRMKSKWLPLSQILPIVLWFISEVWPKLKGQF